VSYLSPIYISIHNLLLFCFSTFYWKLTLSWRQAKVKTKEMFDHMSLYVFVCHKYPLFKTTLCSAHKMWRTNHVEPWTQGPLLPTLRTISINYGIQLSCGKNSQTSEEPTDIYIIVMYWKVCNYGFKFENICPWPHQHIYPSNYLQSLPTSKFTILKLIFFPKVPSFKYFF
jgi:hypothetical protein